MYIEVRNRSGKHYVIIHQGGSKVNAGKAIAQFVGTENEAKNVAKQFARQLSCLIKYTKGGAEIPSSPPDGYAES
jgi:hypothetical protein